MAEGFKSEPWKVKHGLYHHPLYSIWRNIIYRCTNANSSIYRYYGGRGIQIDAEWRKSAKIFIEWARQNGWRKGLCIDRIDNDGNYEPGNCRFVTNAENQQTRRRPTEIKSKGSDLPIGVSKNRKRFAASIKIKYKKIHLGTFDTPEEASECYWKARNLLTDKKYE